MFSKSKNRFLGLAVSIAFASAAQVHTVDAAVASINEANLPINVSNQETAKAVSEQNKPANALVSPSRAKAVANTAVQAGSAGQNNSVSAAGNTADAKVSGNSDANAPVSPAQNNAAVSSAAKNTSAAQPAVQAPLPQQNQAQAKEDFNFDLKMKSINAPTQQNANNAAPVSKTGGASINDADLPKDIQYKANPVEALGNSVLSQMKHKRLYGKRILMILPAKKKNSAFRTWNDKKRLKHRFFRKSRHCWTKNSCLRF